ALSAAAESRAKGMRRSGHAFERPDQNVEPARKMAERRAVERERGDGRQLDLGLGGLERPRSVMDLGAMQLAAVVRRVEAVALDEEGFERARLGLDDRAVRPVA